MIEINALLINRRKNLSFEDEISENIDNDDIGLEKSFDENTNSKNTAQQNLNNSILDLFMRYMKLLVTNSNQNEIIFMKDKYSFLQIFERNIFNDKKFWVLFSLATENNLCENEESILKIIQIGRAHV